MTSPKLSPGGEGETISYGIDGQVSRVYGMLGSPVNLLVEHKYIVKNYGDKFTN